MKSRLLRNCAQFYTMVLEYICNGYYNQSCTCYTHIANCEHVGMFLSLLTLMYHHIIMITHKLIGKLTCFMSFSG